MQGDNFDPEESDNPEDELGRVDAEKKVYTSTDERVSDQAEPRDSELEAWTIPGPFTGVGPGGCQRPDEHIQQEIRTRLAARVDLDAGGLTVRVENGAVSLDGQVRDEEFKHQLESDIRSVSGVRTIHTRLSVKKD